jgi:hypothetical protein
VAVDPGQTLKLWQRCRAKKDPVDAYVLEILQYLCPRLTNKVSGRIAAGQKQTVLQYDSAGEDAGQKLAAALAGGLSSAAQKWFRLVPREYALRELRDFMAWLEECADRLYAAFNNSNFNIQIAETYLGVVYIGTAAIFMEEAQATRIGGFPGFRFKTLGFGEYCYEEDAYGVVNNLYHNFDITFGAAALVPGWRKAMTPEQQAKVESAPEEEFEILHHVYPRMEYNRRRRDNLNMPYGSCYIATKGAVLFEEGGFHEFPLAVPRWAQSPGEIYGRGPGHRAYPDVRSQNRLVQLELEAGSKAVDPTLLVLHEAIMGDPTLNPAGINAIDGSLVGNDIRRAVMPLESASNFPWVKDRLERLEKKIRDSFHNGLLEVPERDRMSATEFAGRLEQIQRMLGPTFGRMNYELLSVLVNRGFNMMLRGGAFPPPPPVPREYVNSDIDVVFEGPLARAQRSSDLIAIQRKNEWVIGQVNVGNTSALDLFDIDEEGREVAEIVGLPANITRDKKDVEGIRAAKAQAAKQQAAQASLEQMATGMGKAAPALDKLPRTANKMDAALAGAQ